MLNNGRFSPTICLIVTTLCIFIVYFISNNYNTTKSFQNILIRSFIDNTSDNNKSNNNIQFSVGYFQNYIQADDDLRVRWLETIKRYTSLPLSSGYGSHKLVLLAASILTADDTKPVMEMGCGYHSTVLFHQIVVNEQKRFLLSTDTDRAWLSKFEANMSSPLHQFRHVAQTSEWDNIGVDRPRWSIVFIDHKPGERRVVDIIRLASVTDIMIVHDTETAGYHYEQGLSQFPYRYRFNYLSVFTDVLSKSNGTLHRRIQRLLELTTNMKLPKE